MKDDTQPHIFSHSSDALPLGEASLFVNVNASSLSYCAKPPFTTLMASVITPVRYLSSMLLALLLLSPLTPSHALAEELIAADALLNPAPDSAKPEPNSTPPVSSTSNDALIETKPSPEKDADIRERISGIFSEIDGLQAVTVTVNKGVVILGGEVPNEKKAQQAINLTNRLSDVVTVEDGISRTLDVQDNVSTVYQGLKGQFKNFLKAAPLLLVAILVFLLVAWFGMWLSARDKLWCRLAPNPFVAELLAQTIKVVFVILGLILALSLVGAEAIIGTLLGGAGVIGIAVGFAVKDTIENYISSLMLSVRQPFRARDHIDINGREGIVVRLTSRATILMTMDGNQLRIPNSEVFKGTILNYTKNPERRFTFELGVDANNDPLAAIKVGLDAIRALTFVLNEPKSTAIITEVGDSNIVLQFQVWVDQSNSDFAKARSITIRETKHALENNGFNLPEPIYQLRFEQQIEAAIKSLASSSISNNTGVDNDMDSSVNNHHDNSVANNLDKKAEWQPNTQPTTEDVQLPHSKQQAKERAKQILQGANAEELLTALPDKKLMEKVEQEIADNQDATDLLDQNSPQE